MFAPHFATGYLFFMWLKHPRSTFLLFLMVLSTQFLDILWGLFTILGIEGGISGGHTKDNLYNIEFSHSLVMTFVWSLLFGALVWFLIQSKMSDVHSDERRSISIISGIGVFSHFILDFPMHRSDILLFPGGDPLPTPYLWENATLAFFLELSIVLVSWAIYYRYMRSSDNYKASMKMIGALIFLVVLTLFTYLPSFLGGIDPTQATPISGMFILASLVIISALLAKLHN